MRIILKPIGTLALLTAICVLVALVIAKTRGNRVTTAPTAPTAPTADAASTKTTAGDSVINPDDMPWKMIAQPPAEAVMTNIVAADLPDANKHAVRLVVTKVVPEKFWCAQLLKEVPQTIPANKAMVVHFWGRSRQKTPIWVVMEGGESPHTPELQENITLSEKWKQYELPFTTTEDHTKSHANFCIKAGTQRGEIEVADIFVDEK